MEENETVKYLYSLKAQGAKLGLRRMEKLLAALGNPERSFKSILVAGTNGKGSTVAMIYSILRKAGFSVGRYTSPHISCLNERIMVDDKEIEDEKLFVIVNRIRKTIELMKENPDFEQPTFFEATTAAAFLYYRECKVDYVVLEVGMGGRLDATNTVTPVASVITNISLEHTKILGDTIEKIAFEKAGIVKNNGFLVTAAEGSALRVIEKMCRERNSRIRVVGGKDVHGYEVALAGDHQRKNAACAVAVAKELEISKDAIIIGLKEVDWPGRMEIVQENPTVMLDCAKDAEATRALAKEVKKLGKKVVLVISISSDKKIEEMVGALGSIANYVVIAKHKVMDRAIDPKIIANLLEEQEKEYEIVLDVKDAVKKAMAIAKSDWMVLVSGSVFTVAEAREIWFNKNKSELGLEFNDTVLPPEKSREKQKSSAASKQKTN